MELAKTLIDKASEVCGSDVALAKRMGIYPADVSHLRSGKRPLSPELAAELADIAGENAREAAIEAIVQRAKGTRKESVLREILGKALAGGVAAMLVISYNVGSNGENVSRTGSAYAHFNMSDHVNSLYIVSNRIRAWLARLAGFLAQKNTAF